MQLKPALGLPPMQLVPDQTTLLNQQQPNQVSPPIEASQPEKETCNTSGFKSRFTQSLMTKQEREDFPFGKK